MMMRSLTLFLFTLLSSFQFSAFVASEEIEKNHDAEMITGYNTSITVTINVMPSNDELPKKCTPELLEHEQNITTFNMTMIMMNIIGETLPNQTVYIEEFADYYKCPTYHCDYWKRCSIYCSEVVIIMDETDDTYAWRNLSSNTFDRIKVDILDDHRSMIKDDIIQCNGYQDKFMMQYFVSKPRTLKYWKKKAALEEKKEEEKKTATQ